MRLGFLTVGGADPIEFSKNPSLRSQNKVETWKDWVYGK